VEGHYESKWVNEYVVMSCQHMMADGVVRIRLVILIQRSVAKRDVRGESMMFLVRCDMLHINELSAHDGQRHS
jgi:hypothetical protein